MFLFDCEVFKYDWLFVFRNTDNGEFTVIHNNDFALKSFITDHTLLCGFNNKFYDNSILKAILCGANNATVKDISDYIIDGNKPWTHPFLATCRANFNTFDLKDDMYETLSLKAIEGHLGLPIMESPIDFDIDRPLTPSEVELVVKYCQNDVIITGKILTMRRDYLNSKLIIGQMKNIAGHKALFKTNAKLTAEYLNANHVSFNDERNYQFPRNLKLEYIPEVVLSFVNKIKDKSIPDDVVFQSKLAFKIADCTCTVGFGGMHGAVAAYHEIANIDRLIINIDVASYYPNLVINDGYCSRAVYDPSVYEELVKNRLEAKRLGQTDKANALKLICNTTVGAMYSKGNELYDPLMFRSVTITGQLRLIELARRIVEKCKTIKLIQINTDGMALSINTYEYGAFKEACQAWEHDTGFVLEEDLLKEIVQKDVNNYLTIDMHDKVKIKGGILVRGISTAGAWNINNNANIIAKAIVDHFTKNKSVELTISECNTPVEFQYIVKTTGKYSDTFHIQNGSLVPVQRCNRIYATADPKLGGLVKVHKQSKTTVKIGNLPEHCIIDNNNEVAIENIDKRWYIATAKKQIKLFDDNHSNRSLSESLFATLEDLSI